MELIFNTDNLSAIQKARLSNHLGKRYRFPWGVGTVSEDIARKITPSSKKVVWVVPSVKWNRVKYNRMNSEEQEAYEKKLNKTKKEYYIFNPEQEIYTSIAKIVYDCLELDALDDMRVGQ